MLKNKTAKLLGTAIKMRFFHTPPPTTTGAVGTLSDEVDFLVKLQRHLYLEKHKKYPDIHDRKINELIYKFSYDERAMVLDLAIKSNDAELLKTYSLLVKRDLEIDILRYWIASSRAIKPGFISFESQIERMVIDGADRPLAYLISLGYDLTNQHKSYTLLHLLGNRMTHENHLHVLDLLIKAGVDVNALDQSEGSSVLVRIIRHCNHEALLLKAVQLLLDHDADPGLKDTKRFQDDALTAAHRYARYSVVALLHNQLELHRGYIPR